MKKLLAGNKKYICLLLLLIACVISWQLIGFIIEFHDYRTILKTYNSKGFLDVTPKNENWENISNGEPLQLGYFTVNVDKNIITKIEYLNDRGNLYVTFKDGCEIAFHRPFVKTYEQYLKERIELRSALGKKVMWHLPRIEQLIYLKAGAEWPLFPEKWFNRYFIDFQWQKQARHVKPLDSIDYIFMDEDFQLEHLAMILKKLGGYNQKGMILFNALDIEGIVGLGAEGRTTICCEIWDKHSDIQQILLIYPENSNGSFDLDDAVKSIISSITYKINELPTDEELDSLILNDIKKTTWYSQESDMQREN